MKKIIYYLKSYLADHFDWRLFGSLLAILAALIWFNYYYFDIEINGKISHRTFEKHVLDSYYKQPIYLLLNFVYYCVPYLIGALAVALFGKNFQFFKKPGFWLVLAVFALALSLDDYYHWYWIPDERELRLFGYKISQKLSRTSLYLLPIFIYWVVRHKGQGSFFGLTRKGFDASPYLLMMVIMIPLLVWASFQPSFLEAYPTYTPGKAAHFLNVPVWSTFAFYEVLYGFTFLALEVLIRGFLLFEMEKFLGEKVVIPMVCVYCTVHFGKPMMECISSIFGGFLLGVIAIKSRSVYGGVWVHVFIALGMDVMAFLQEEYLMD